MKAKVFQYTGIRQTDDTSRQIQAVARALSAFPLLDGVLLDAEPTTGVTGLTFTAGQTRELTHGLGRAYRGFMVVGDFGASASALRSVTTASTDDATIRLTHGGASACTVCLWVW